MAFSVESHISPYSGKSVSLWSCSPWLFSNLWHTFFFNGAFISRAVIRETMKQLAFPETRCGLLGSDAEGGVGGKHAPKKQFLSSSFIFFFLKRAWCLCQESIFFLCVHFLRIQKKLLMKAGQISERTLEQNWGSAWIREYHFFFLETAGKAHIPFLLAESVCHDQPGLWQLPLLEDVSTWSLGQARVALAAAPSDPKAVWVPRCPGSTPPHCLLFVFPLLWFIGLGSVAASWLSAAKVCKLLFNS